MIKRSIPSEKEKGRRQIIDLKKELFKLSSRSFAIDVRKDGIMRQNRVEIP